MSGPEHNPTVPLVVDTPFDRAVEAERMAREVKECTDYGRKIFLALKLVDFLIQSP